MTRLSTQNHGFCRLFITAWTRESFTMSSKGEMSQLITVQLILIELNWLELTLSIFVLHLSLLHYSVVHHAALTCFALYWIRLHSNVLHCAMLKRMVLYCMMHFVCHLWWDEEYALVLSCCNRMSLRQSYVHSINISLQSIWQWTYVHLPNPLHRITPYLTVLFRTFPSTQDKRPRGRAVHR